jgi:hypothetical protein
MRGFRFHYLSISKHSLGGGFWAQGTGIDNQMGGFSSRRWAIGWEELVSGGFNSLADWQHAYRDTQGRNGWQNFGYRCFSHVISSIQRRNPQTVLFFFFHSFITLLSRAPTYLMEPIFQRPIVAMDDDTS